MAYFVEVDNNIEKPKIKSYSNFFVEDILPEKCVVGYNVLNIFDPRDRGDVMNDLRTCMTHGVECILKCKTLAASKTSNAFPVWIRIPWVLSFKNDTFHMTAERHYDDLKSIEADELRDFFNKAPIALHWLSDEGKVLWANDRELSVLGYSREEYIGEDIMKFCPDSCDDVLEIFKDLGSGKTIRDVPIRFRTKDGRIKDLLIDSNVNYKVDGSFNHTRCFIRDDTGRKIREAREQTTKDLREKLVVEKENFIAKVIHHVKTPLHLMRMQVGVGDHDNLDLRLQGMAKMMSNLSDAVKFDKGYTKPIDLVDADLCELLSSARFAEDVQVEFNVSDVSHKMVRVDTNMLMTIIEEVVIFCHGYSSNGVVKVDATNSSKTSDGVCKYKFCISYVGKVLDEVVVHRLFHSYWTSDCLGTVDESPTLGVGLNVAFNYTQCLGSDLAFSSNSSSGPSSSFSFDLDLHVVSPPQVKRKSISTDWTELPNLEISNQKKQLGLNDSSPRHILVVEDNTICSKLLKRVINKLGHTCQLAENGAVAVDLVCKVEYVIFDLVLMDIRMPIMDGIEATRLILDYVRKEGVQLPIVAVSAEERIDDDLGFTSFLKKPSRPADIDRVICQYAY